MRVCKIEGCEDATNARGWCNTHYMRWYKHGDPLVVKQPRYQAKIAEEDEVSCRVEDCPKVVNTSGYCSMHYGRLHRYGDLNRGRQSTGPTRPWKERFWEKVNKNGPWMPGMNSRCWAWTAAQSGEGWDKGIGYGTFYQDGDYKPAHRVSYEEYVGPLPEGYVPDHLCRFKPCVNYNHLEGVPFGENVRRGYHNQRRKTHCPQGHPYDEANTRRYQVKSKYWVRECRECHRIKDRRRRAKKAEV